MIETVIRPRYKMNSRNHSILPYRVQNRRLIYKKLVEAGLVKKNDQLQDNDDLRNQLLNNMDKNVTVENGWNLIKVQEFVGWWRIIHSSRSHRSQRICGDHNSAIL